MKCQICRRKYDRFFGRWRDPTTFGGEYRHFRVHFYREDETAEVLETHDKNCGRYKAPLFLKRRRLPKVNRRFVFFYNREIRWQKELFFRKCKWKLKNRYIGTGTIFPSKLNFV